MNRGLFQQALGPPPIGVTRLAAGGPSDGVY